MSTRSALIVWGGWDGHEPENVANLFASILSGEGFDVEVSNTLDSFLDAERLRSLHLIVPVWTMGRISAEQCGGVLAAVASGVGLAGCHGGMCDSFRDNTDWQFMTGGQWVAHPGNDGVEYRIEIRRELRHPITDGIEDFDVKSEQYYMHVDPAVQVLATTTFPTPGADGPHSPNGSVLMPVIWTKRWGEGRVFYTSLGHQRDVLERAPVPELLRRGLLWSAKD